MAALIVATTAFVSTVTVAPARTHVKGLQIPHNVSLPFPSSFPCRNLAVLHASKRLQRASSVSVNAMAQHVDVSKVVPQADRVLIRLFNLDIISELKSAGGVLLPKSAVKFERYLMGEVVSVGTEAGIVDAGKKVLFSDINAYEVNLGTPEKHCFCRAGDLLAVVE